MYDNIMFDLYGTLIDNRTHEDDIAVWKHMCGFYAAHGIKYNAAELRSRYKSLIKKEQQALFKKKIKVPEVQILNVFAALELAKRTGDQTAPALAEEAAWEFRRMATEYIRLYDGVEEMLAKLKTAGARLYVLSNAQRAFTEPELAELGIVKYFEEISLSSDFGAMKPDTAFYQQILERNRLNPDRTLMVGNDYACDILAAARVRVHTCYVHSNLSPEADAKQEIRADILADAGDIPDLCERLLQDAEERQI